MKRNIILIVICFSIILSISGCKSNGVVIKVMSDYPIAVNYQMVIDESDIIVIGDYMEYKESINMARNMNDITKEDDQRYVEGKIYAFEVDKYLYGSGSKIIDVILLYANDGIIDETFYEPKFYEKVVLCLKYNEDFDHYYAAIYPYEFVVNKDMLNMRTNVNLIEDNFKNKSKNMDEFLDDIKNYQHNE